MAKNNERNLNITIKNQEDKDEIIISVSSIFAQLKRFLVLWIVAAIIAGLAVFSLSALRIFSSSNPAEAIVSFTYDGIEQGLDPKKGGEFKIESMKSPKVIEMALTDLGIDLEKVEDIRANTKFTYKLPQDTYEKLKAYNSVMEKATNGSLTAAQAMLDTKYYPTQYSIIFDYSKAGFDKTTGTEILNKMVDCYGTYFYQLYGFNKPLGTAVTALETDDYDYAQQVDTYRLSLRQVKNYVDSLVKEDSTAFRSSITGYSFSDLSEYANNVSSVDLDRISSYISVNNVTKNKEATLAYYDYRIENLTRDKDEYAERLAALNASISAYQKDTITIYGENTKNESTVHSDQYDSLFRTKTTIEASLAQTTQDIKFYESRRDALKSNKTSSTANIKNVESDLAELREKIDKLIELTELTANDYYENVQFANAYNVLAYATKSVPAGISQALSASLKKIIVYEILLFAIYLAIAVIASLRRSNRKAAPAAGDDDEDDEEEADLEDVIEAIEESAEKKETKPSGKSKKK